MIATLHEDVTTVNVNLLPDGTVVYVRGNTDATFKYRNNELYFIEAHDSEGYNVLPNESFAVWSSILHAMIEHPGFPHKESLEGLVGIGHSSFKCKR